MKKCKILGRKICKYDIKTIKNDSKSAKTAKIYCRETIKSAQIRVREIIGYYTRMFITVYLVVTCCCDVGGGGGLRYTLFLIQEYKKYS